MSSNLLFYQQLVSSLAQGPVVVATVIGSSGSVPREVGAKLLLCADGQVLGTIGGGAGEAKVLRQAETVLATGEKQRVTIDLSGAPQREIQGICGGQMQVWLERWEGEAAIALAHRILHHLNQGQSVTLITPLRLGQFPYLADSQDPGDEDALVTSSLSFQETLHPPPTLLIVGAGHCGIQLAKVASLAGFQVMVQDDRANWANSQNFPQANRLFTASMPDAVNALADYGQLYAALVTRGFDYDLPALQALLNRHPHCRYIGMIGSQKRVRKVLQALSADYLSQQQLESLYAPIGLDIGALTPEEIAVSITAELIMVRRGGTGQPLRIGAFLPPV